MFQGTRSSPVICLHCWLLAGLLGPLTACATAPASRPATAVASTAPATRPAALSAPGLNAAQRAAAERMAAAAEAAYRAVCDLENVRVRTPEFLQLKLSCVRRRLEVQLLLFPAGSQRTTLEGYVAAARQAYADAKARESIDATTFSINMAAFALAEAEYLLASEGTLSPAHTPEQQAIAQRMNAGAAAAYQGLLDLENIRGRTPEFLQLRLEACRRLCDVQLLLNPAAPQRQAIVERYLTQARQCYADIVARRGIDATRASIAMADYARAEAECLAAPPPAPAPIVAQILSAAQQANAGLLELQDMRSPTPEWWELRRDWAKKLLQARQMSHPLAADRRRDVEAYAADSRLMSGEIQKRINIDATPADLALAEYADAQADFWLAAEARP